MYNVIFCIMSIQFIFVFFSSSNMLITGQHKNVARRKSHKYPDVTVGLPNRNLQQSEKN